MTAIASRAGGQRRHRFHRAGSGVELDEAVRDDGRGDGTSLAPVEGGRGKRCRRHKSSRQSRSQDPEPALRASRARFRRAGKLRVLVEDPPLECAQLAAGLDAELVEHRLPRRLVRGQGFRLSSTCVQREHQLPAEALAKRMSGGELLELGDECRTEPGGELGVETLLDGDEAKLFEPDGLGRRAVEGNVGCDGTAPERLGLPVARAGDVDVHLAELACLADEAVEDTGVDRRAIERQAVAARVTADGVLTDDPPQACDVDSEAFASAGGRRLGPEHVEQLLVGRPASGLEHQQTQQQSKLVARDRDGDSVDLDQEWAEHEIANVRGRPARRQRVANCMRNVDSCPRTAWRSRFRLL